MRSQILASFLIFMMSSLLFCNLFASEIRGKNQLGKLTQMSISERASSQKSDGPIYVFSHINNRYKLLAKTLFDLSLIDSSNNWQATGATVILLGNLTSESSSFEILKFVRKLQESALSRSNSVRIILGENDLKLLTNSIASSENEQRSELRRWLAQQDFILETQGQVFTSGGVSKVIKSKDILDINRKLRKSLSFYLKEKRKQRAIEQGGSILFSKNWPHNYSGNSYCHPLFEQQNIDEALSHWNAKRIWVGSKKYHIANVEARFQSRMIFFDMQDSPANIWGAKIEKNGSYHILKDSREFVGTVSEIPARHYSMPYGMNEVEVSDFLKNAKIVSKSKTKEGRTKPLKVFLEKDDKKVKAIFKSVNRSGKRSHANVPKSGDKYDYEMAAYYLGKMLDINVIPISVERAFSGRRGAMQLWIDDLTSSLALASKEEIYSGECDAEAQENFMNSFDYLIMNLDRNQSNIVFSKKDWQIWFIDHSRSFGLGMSTKELLNNREITPSIAFKNKLRSLNREDMNVLKKWLSKRQIDKVWKRRERLLESKSIRH